MNEKFGHTLNTLGSALRKGKESFRKALEEHDETLKLRRRSMVENLRTICQERGITSGTLTQKKLKQLLDEYPDKFYGLKSAVGIINTYFMSDMSMLKELVFEENQPD